MTATATLTLTLNPQIVGQAENAHLPILNRVLSGSGITKNQWVTLTIAVSAGAPLAAGQLAGRVVDALKVDVSAAQTAISELTASGLLHELPGQHGVFSVTEAGQAEFRRVRTATGEVVARAYADIPTEDLETAARVLTLITTRLNQELTQA